MYLVALFFLISVLSPLILKLPRVWRRILFISPFVGTFFEALRPFVLQSWEYPRDGLSDFFASIAGIVGICVVIYAESYFAREERARFFPMLLAFAGAMFGVLWSDNIFFIYGFWEATSFCSFLLIAFKYTEEPVRKGARLALAVNTVGGLSLLLAFLVLWQVTGVTSLAQILEQRDVVLAHAEILTPLILLAAMTKSAQFPLHFWLPRAMLAPTPASCYLHSATMVKLGIFLLIKFSILFQANARWATVLGVIGVLTLVWGLLVSLIKTDLKQLFAWTTVSSLGGMALLVSLNISYSWKAFFSYMLAHACYKASLFLCVGNIDKQMGTRNVYHISHLYKKMPLTSVAMILALGSMIGFPLSMGFLGKEYLLKSAMAVGGETSVLVAVLVGSSALSFVVAYRVLMVIFSSDKTPHLHLKEAPPSMWGPALFLAGFGWITSLFLEPINDYFVKPVIGFITNNEVLMTEGLQMFTGINWALGLSFISFALGLWVSRRFLRHIMGIEMWMRYDRSVTEKRSYLSRWGERMIEVLQDGRLSHYLMWTLYVLVFGGLILLGTTSSFAGTLSVLPTEMQVIPLLFTIGGGLGLLVPQRPFVHVMSLGIVGFGVSLFYMESLATDLAMTQMSVEVLSLIVLVCCLPWLRRNRVQFKRSYQMQRLFLSLGAAVGSFSLWQVMQQGKIPSEASKFFFDQALPLGRGHNPVNVILVDFRAFDTLGESMVLALVALGVGALIPHRAPLKPVFRPSIILATGVKISAVLFGLVSVFILLRGHNQPGGGFVGGLLLALATSFLAMVFGKKEFFSRLWIGGGLLVCLAAGLLGYYFEGNFLRAVWFETPLAWLNTPLIFDVGIYLLVYGVSTSLALNFLRKLT